MAQYNARYYGNNVTVLFGSIKSVTFLWLFYKLLLGASMGVTPGREGMNECVCPGDNLIYMCNVQGHATGATIWKGTAFSNCPQDDILLLHHRFTPTGGPTGTCNNGDIVGQNLGIQENNYTSQLNVTITPDTAGKTIICAYDALTADQTSDMIQFSSIVPGRLPPPNELNLSAANFVSRELTFTWSPVAPDCSAIHYNILASNCGSCPTTTNHTSATCTDVPTSHSMCIFAVQTVLCGNLAGNLSDLINTTTSVERSTDTCMRTNTTYTIAISFLAAALITSVVVFVTTIVIILKRSKAKIKAALDQQQASRAERSTHMESMYEDVTDPTPSVSAINTQDNVAYGHTQSDNTCV